MPSEAKTFLRFLLIGAALSIATCFFPYDRCACGGYARGLPLMFLDPHGSLLFLFIALAIDITFWGAAVYGLVRFIRWIRRVAGQLSAP